MVTGESDMTTRIGLAILALAACLAVGILLYSRRRSPAEEIVDWAEEQVPPPSREDAAPDVAGGVTEAVPV
jgi:hypothetical protein